MYKDLSCPKCGAGLDVHEGQRLVKCKFCGTSSLLEQESGEAPKLTLQPPKKSPITPDGNLISIEDLKVYYSLGGGLFSQARTVKAVDGVSLNIKKGETLGLV